MIKVITLGIARHPCFNFRLMFRKSMPKNLFNVGNVDLEAGTQHIDIVDLFRKMFKITGLPYEVKPPYTHVAQIGDPVLRSTAREVDTTHLQDPELKKLLRILVAILIKDNLAGMSAPQLGIPLRVIAIQCETEVLQSYYTPQEIAAQQIKELPPQIWINPVMKVLDYNTNIDSETCTSVLGLKADVKRFNKVSLIGFDAEGAKKIMEGSGLIARIIQHEMDHLDGNLFTDKMNPKTLECCIWKEINELNGFVELSYAPRSKG